MESVNVWLAEVSDDERSSALAVVENIRRFATNRFGIVLTRPYSDVLSRGDRYLLHVLKTEFSCAQHIDHAVRYTERTNYSQCDGSWYFEPAYDSSTMGECEGPHEMSGWCMIDQRGVPGWTYAFPDWIVDEECEDEAGTSDNPGVIAAVKFGEDEAGGNHCWLAFDVAVIVVER